MGDAEKQEYENRKRRRRSARYLRRRSDVLPPVNLNSLDEEESNQENGEEPESGGADMYGSMWFESQSPVVKKRRRRSSMFTGLPARPLLSEVDEDNQVSIDSVKNSPLYNGTEKAEFHNGLTDSLGEHIQSSVGLLTNSPSASLKLTISEQFIGKRTKLKPKKQVSKTSQRPVNNTKITENVTTSTSSAEITPLPSLNYTDVRKCSNCDNDNGTNLLCENEIVSKQKEHGGRYDLQMFTKDKKEIKSFYHLEPNKSMDNFKQNVCLEEQINSNTRLTSDDSCRECSTGLYGSAVEQDTNGVNNDLPSIDVVGAKVNDGMEQYTLGDRLEELDRARLNVSQAVENWNISLDTTGDNKFNVGFVSDSISETPENRESINKTPRNRDCISKTPGNHDCISKTPGEYASVTKTPGNHDSITETPGNPDCISKTPGKRDCISKTPGKHDCISKTPEHTKTVCDVTIPGESSYSGEECLTPCTEGNMSGTKVSPASMSPDFPEADLLQEQSYCQTSQLENSYLDCKIPTKDTKSCNSGDIKTNSEIGILENDLHNELLDDNMSAVAEHHEYTKTAQSPEQAEVNKLPDDPTAVCDLSLSDKENSIVTDASPCKVTLTTKVKAKTVMIPDQTAVCKTLVTKTVNFITPIPALVEKHVDFSNMCPTLIEKQVDLTKHVPTLMEKQFDFENASSTYVVAAVTENSITSYPAQASPVGDEVTGEQVRVVDEVVLERIADLNINNKEGCHKTSQNKIAEKTKKTRRRSVKLDTVQVDEVKLNDKLPNIEEEPSCKQNSSRVSSKPKKSEQIGNLAPITRADEQELDKVEKVKLIDNLPTAEKGLSSKQNSNKISMKSKNSAKSGNIASKASLYEQELDKLEEVKVIDNIATVEKDSDSIQNGGQVSTKPKRRRSAKFGNFAPKTSLEEQEEVRDVALNKKISGVSDVIFKQNCDLGVSKAKRRRSAKFDDLLLEGFAANNKQIVNFDQNVEAGTKKIVRKKPRSKPTQCKSNEALVSTVSEVEVDKSASLTQLTDEISQVSLSENSTQPPTVAKPTSSDVSADQQITAESLELPEAPPAGRRRRRRSAEAATLKIQMIQDDGLNTSSPDYSSPKTSVSKTGRKRKHVEETPEVIENIYRNKNFVKPDERKPWQTIIENPPKSGDCYGKKRLQRYIEFEKPTQMKLRRRLLKARKNGWDPYEKQHTELKDEFVQVKLANLWTELDTGEEECMDTLQAKLRNIVETQ